MSEFRQNIVTKEWVIIDPERSLRPKDFICKEEEKCRFTLPPNECHFCPGNEKDTPEAVYTIEKDGKWVLRIVPNKYAALKPYLSPERSNVGKFLKCYGFGFAEVIIETPTHNQIIATMSDEEVINIISAYRHRALEISKVEGINLVIIFKNHGDKAGTSIEHPHSQLIASPIIPPHIRNPLHQAILSYDSYGKCIYCVYLEEELKQEKRIILETEHFVAFAPFASRTPFETRIYPKRHCPSFKNITDDEVVDFAKILKKTLAKIYKGLNDPDYNFLINTAPIGEENAKYYHWYMIIIPKLTTPAGFEIGTGIYINTSSPEECARRLREVEE